MASLKDIRRRVASVKNTQQITKAMKMIAAVKLRKAQDRIIAARPYAHELIEVISNLVIHGGVRKHPLLVNRKPKRARLFIVSSDRGLCGGYNTSIIRRAERFIAETKDTFEDFRVSFIGRKAHEYFKKRLPPEHFGKYYPDIISKPTFEHASTIANEIMDEFLKNNLDHVYFIYNEFKSAISQKVVAETLLPAKPKREAAERIQSAEYIFEPSAEEVLSGLLPKHIRIQVCRILLEAASAEHGARMTAMDSATRNAGEMISELTLQANRVRQAAITRELMEIVGGAEALK